VDRGVIATASELFEGRHYPSVVAVCSDALDEEPECIPLLLMRARANMALHRDMEAQPDLRDVIRLDSRCAIAYRLLGELATRREQNDAASTFFREALRLDPSDRVAAERLRITDALVRPAAVAQKLPAPATAAGHLRSTVVPRQSEPRQSEQRFARGTQQPQHDYRARAYAAYDPDAAHNPPDERPTKPFGLSLDRSMARGLDQAAASWAPTPTRPMRPPTPLPQPHPESSAPPQRLQDLPEEVIPLVNPKHGEKHGEKHGQKLGEIVTLRGRPVTSTPPAKEAPRLSQRPMRRSSIPELPGFGEYLVASGILTRERLRAAQAYQRSMNVQLSTAIVTLGLATPQRIEWASVAHQSQLARGQ
jgi:hypothetical protein